MSYVVLAPLNFDPHPPRKTVRGSAENKYPLPSLGKENNIPGPPTAHNTKHLQDPARSACQPQAYPVLARLATMVGRTVSCQWCDDPCLRSLTSVSLRMLKIRPVMAEQTLPLPHVPWVPLMLGISCFFIIAQVKPHLCLM